MAIAVLVVTGVLPDIPRKWCCIMRNNWPVSWMTWCLPFVYDSFHPRISACMGYKYVVSTNPQTGIKLCYWNSSLLFGWNPSDSDNPGNRRGLAAYRLTGGMGLFVILGSFFNVVILARGVGK